MDQWTMGIIFGSSGVDMSDMSLPLFPPVHFITVVKLAGSSYDISLSIFSLAILPM
jgi:hypothetical protein